MANTKRTYSTVYNALQQISDEEGIDFGLGGYTEQQFKDKYFTGPGNINNLYNKLSQISDEEGVDFGLGTRSEWLGSFGFTEEDAMPKQGYKPTAEDIAGFNSTIKNAGRTAGSSLGSFDRKLQNIQKRQGLNVPSRIEVGKSNNLTQGRQQLNPETGQLENTYITSSGNEYGNEALADMEQRQIDQNVRDERYKQSLPGQLDDAYAERDRLNAELAKLQGQWVDQDGRVHYGNRGNDEAAASLEAALRQNQQRITALEAERDDDGGTQFWRGFIDAAQNPSTLTFGMSDFGDMVQLMRIKNKMDAAVESGQQPQLSDAEQSLLESSYLNNYAQQQYGENRGFMYRAGGISMQALPFVAEFMATGGMGAISQKGAELGTRAAEKLALQGLSRSLVKNLGVLAGDVAAGWAMANTTGVFRTAGDVMQRNMGGVTINPEGQYDFGEYDDEGNYHRGGKSLGRSIYEAEVANTLEYYTEKLGDHLKLGKRIAGVAEKLGLSKLSKAVNYLSGNKWLERGGIQDYPSEVVEEEANLILYAALVGDNKFSDLDPRSKTQMDIWGGMLFSIGLMQAPRLAYTGYSAAGYYAYKKNVDMADGNASVVFGADNWQMIKDEIDNCENDRLGELMQTVINGDMTDEQKTATLNYAKNLVKMRGYNMGMMAGAKDEEEAASNEGMAAQAVNQSYQQGHETQDPDLMKQFNEDILAAEQNLHQYGEEFAKEIVEASEIPVQELNYLMSSRNYFTDEQIAAAADYYTKQARAKGMMEGALDRIDMAVESANAEVRANTHQQTGSVVMAKGNDNLDYYIIGGDIVTDPETGESYLAGTGGAVVVRDQLGNVSVKSPQDLTVYSMQPTEEMVQYNEAILRNQLMQQADDDIMYGSPANEVYQLQDTVTLNDGEGNTITGEIVGMPNSIDGVYQVQTNDTNEPMKYLTADELNRRIIAHNGMEVQRTGGQIGGQNGGQNVPQTEQTGTDTGEYAPEAPENVLNQPQTAESGTDQATGETPTTEESGESNQPQSALSRIPVATDEKGQPIMKKGRPQYQWHKASVEDAAAALIETTDGDMVMARDTASDLITNAKAGLEKIRKQKPKGEDPIEIAESRMEIKRQEQEQQAIIKQWQDVNQAIQKQMNDEAAARQAEAEAAKSEEQRRREAEEARIREEKQREQDRQKLREAIERDREKRNKEYQPLVDARKEMADDADAMAILNDTEPRSIEEWVSSIIRPHSMLWQDASDNEVGLQSELGLKRGDMQRMMSLLGTKESGAKPFGKVVLDIYEGLPEGIRNQYTDEDVRNTLLNLFSEGNSTRMMHLTEENRIEEARQTMLENLRRDAEAEMEAWAEAYHLTPEERETYEEFMSQAPVIPNDPEFINQIIELNYTDEEQNNRGQEVDLDNTSGTTGTDSEGGESQVQGQGAAETAAADQEQPEPEQGAETPSGGQAVPGDNVPGGTPEPGIAPSEQLKPVDLRDNIKPDSAKLGESKAERWALSEKKARNGEPFYQDSNGNIDLVDIPQKIFDKINYTKAPFRLTKSMAEHVFKQHAKELHLQTIDDAIDFVIDVMTNFDHIRLGDNGSLIFSVENGRNTTGKRAITILLSSDSGDYYGIKTSGYESLSKLKKRPLLWDGSAETPSTDTATEPVTSRNAQQGGEQSGSASGQSGLSEGKDTNNSANLQEKTEKSSQKKKKEPKRLVSDEKMEELRKKLLDKLNNLNAGIDPEMMLLGAMYAVGNIERGVTKFADYAKKMVTDLGDKIRPYLKSFYNAVRDMPEAQEYASQMDDYQTVANFDVYNFDKQQAPDTFTKAEQVVTEQKIRKQAKKIQEQQPDLFAGDLFGAQEDSNPIGKTSSKLEIRAEETKVDTDPSEAQKEAGNYQKGHIKIDGYDITIENPKGSIRRGTDASGKPWETEMHYTYGYIRGTEGVDGDHIDVFLSDDPTSGSVFVIDQVNPTTGKFDEHKCMYGFSSEEEAREAYLSNYSKGWKGLGNITEVSREDFKKWIESSHRKTKPFAEYKIAQKPLYNNGTVFVSGTEIIRIDNSRIDNNGQRQYEATALTSTPVKREPKGIKFQISEEDLKNNLNNGMYSTEPNLDKKDYRTYMTPVAREYFANDPRFANFPHRELAFVTAAVWDGVVIPVEELAKIPSIVEAEQRVKAKEQLNPFTLTEEQIEQYAQHLLDSEHGSAVYENGKMHKIDGHDDFTGPVKQERKAFVIIGRPAGGKSSVFANPLSNQYGARIIDSDVVKEWFDEFDDGYGAGYVQEMSSAVAERALDIAAQNGDNIILPRIGGNSVIRVSAALRLLGYDVQLYYNDVVPDTSYMRSTSRFAMTGRYLSLDYLTSIKDKPSKNFSNFAEETLGGYLDECTEEQIQQLRGRLERLAGGQRSDLWRALSWPLDGEGQGAGNESVSGNVEQSESDGASAHLDLDTPIYSYAEWKSNDVAFGEKPKEIWNSESGKPMPGKKVTTNNNNDGQGQGERAGSENQQIDEGISRRELKDSESVVGKRLGEDLSKRGNIRQREGGISQGSPSDSRTVESTGRSSGRIQGLTENPNRNLRNNHAERGKDYAPKGVDARIEANIKAIELMQELTENGEQATPEQMAILRQYSGWGGLGKAFDNKTATYNGKVISSYLKELLGDEAYEQANMSRNSAYFTPANVIDSMWDIARAMGFKGGNVLEGSAGIGNIIGLMPEDMSQRSNIRAVEIDSTTGNILKLLYPDAQVDIQGFEATKVPNGSVDLAITNVPFVTGLRVMDTTGDKDLSRKFHDIHDFCIAKNIRKLKEGGIGIFITSSGTLDNSKALRDWIVSDGNSDVVGAFRLNNETFGGTGATSDIIVVRKRVNGQKSPHAIDVSITSGERSAEYDTGDTKKVKGEYVPVIKKLSMDYNKYLVDHPEMMGGEMMFGFEKGDTYRPTSKALYPAEGKDQNKLLGEFTKSFADKDWQKAPSAETFTDTIYESLGSDVKEGSLLISNGRICVAQMGQAVPLNLNENKIKGHTKEECFNDYQGIKSALSDVLAYQTENEDDKGLNPLLKQLNDAYDTFVERYGHFHKNNQLAWLRNDVDYPNVFALETYKENVDPKTGKNIPAYGKAGIFSKRVVEKEKSPSPQNIKDAIIAGMYVNGRIDTQWIADKLNESGVKPPYNDKWTQDDVRKGIIVSGLGFEDPSTHEMTVAYEYLSGNVREKLQQAIDNNTDGQYDVNIKELEKKQPLDIPAHLIDFSIGSSWIDPKLYEEYVREKTDVDVTFTPAGGTWYMKTPYWVNEEKNKAMGVKSELLNKTILGTQLIEAAMTNKTITVSETRKKWDKSTETITDKDATTACANKIDEIRQDFKDWAKAKMQADSEMAQRIEKKYNDMFNNYVPKSVPDEFVPDHFTGSSPLFTLREHQSKAAIRATTQPLLLAHEVGSGKTFTLITAAMEMRRLGTAKKPMIVVQNATLGQFVGDAKALYPNAKIIALEDKDRSAEKRKDFYARIKYNDWDLVIIPQSVFERIPDSEERQMAYIHEKIKEKMLVLEQMKEADKQGNSMIVRQAEKEIEKLEDQLADLSSAIVTKREKKDEKKKAVARQNAMVKAQEMLDRQTDDVENFDDMGIDALLIDEAHEYKHLGFATAMQRGVKGVDPSYSKKAQGVYLKTQAVLENNNGRNVVFATGTPISNTAAEVWTFMRYLMPADVMKAYDIYYFDDFVRNFGNLTQMLEFTTSGKFKENNRFAGYINLPELARIWSSVADIVTNEEIQRLREAEGKPPLIPAEEGGKDQDIYLPQTKALRSVMKYVKGELDRYEKMSGKEKKQNSHIPLVMYGIAKAAAVDARLVVADAADEPMSKTNAAVKEILADLKATEAYKGTVAVFADNYQNKNTGFNLYEDIQKKLIAAGVPKEQVVVMKSGMSVKKKQDIFDKVNSGDVRVILGSTFTLGTGVNIQERLHLLIHIDAPNRPMDYTQRNGRILRQGNMHKEWGKTVRVVRFGVEDSLDVTAYQRLKTKGAIADSIMHSKDMILNAMENRALEEEEDVFGDTVAQLSGSEYAMLKNQAEKDVRKYEAKKKQWEADQAYVHSEIPKTRSLIRQRQDRIKELEGYLNKIDAVNKENGTDELHPLPITIDGTTYPSIEAMGDYIKEFNKKIKEAENDLRDNPDKVSHRITTKVNVGGVEFPVVTDLSVETKNSQGVLFTAIHRIMTYDCPEFGLKDETVHQSLLRNALEDITQEIMTGKDFRNRLANNVEDLERQERNLSQMEAREGKPFEFTEQLEKAHEHYDEYSELMKKEMEEKEKKYAEIDDGIESAGNVTYSGEAEDEEDEEGNEENLRSSAEDYSVFGEEAETQTTTQQGVENVKKLAETLGLDVEILTSTEGLSGKDAKAYAFFNPRTGKISIVLPNVKSDRQLIRKLMHEGVAHFGLRKMFGENFDNFLDNVYNNVDSEVKSRIDQTAKLNKWSKRLATEEYLASLAEDINYDEAKRSGVWQKIKDFFMDLLENIGVHLSKPLSDDDLRYILWRSHDRLLHPNRNIFDKARDVQMQARFGVNRAENLRSTDYASDEINDIVENAKTDGTYMKAPNGQPTNLSELQWAQVRTKAFKNWFGDWENDPENASKVVDENGEPKVMYHGTNLTIWNKGVPFYTFRAPSHFGTEGQAVERSGFGRGNDVKKMYEVFLNIRNPQRRKDADQDYLEEEDMTMSEFWDQSVERAKRGGHDGIVYLNEYEDTENPADSWIAFKPNQIKSANENVGTFSSEDDDIRYSSSDDDVVTPDFTDDDIAQTVYNQALAKGTMKWKEAWQDSMVSLKAIQDAIARETGNTATGAEDAYRFENRMHGRAKNMSEQFDWQYYQPLLKAFDQFTKDKRMSIEQAMDYMIAKHGLERNMYYSFRDAMKEKVLEQVKDEREQLEKEYAKGRMSELDYNKELARLKELEETGVDDAISELRASDEYIQLQEDYANGKISYPEYIKANEELRRDASQRKTPKKDEDGNIVSTNYYDDHAQDFSGLTGTLAKDMYNDAQKVKRLAQRTVDPETRKRLWQAYDKRMREAYQVARGLAEDMVYAAEDPGTPMSETAAGKLWDAVNAATKRTLQMSYEGGMMDRKTYDKVRKMFDYYIPLRGWAEDKASDVYSYIGKDNVFSPAVKKTWGRTSEAENPLAYIGNIAVSTILAGHRNLMKQHFLNYVMNNPTSLVSVSESWYENIGTENGEPVWVLRSADTAGKSPDEVVQIVNDFNEEMRLKQAEGKAIPVTGRLRLDVNATKGQKAEHVVEVQRAGHSYQMYINGDPRAAQALNGTIDKAVSRISDTWAGKHLTNLNRSMAAFFTSKNPAFIVSNLSRDLNMAGASVAVKEGKEYNARFIANVIKVLAPRAGESAVWIPSKKQPTGLMPSLMRKYKKGTLNMSNNTERYFKEFMDEGAETGFVNMLSVDSFKEKMQKEIRQMQGSSLLGGKVKETSVGKALRLLGETFEFYNRCAEDATRFIVYMTSRQMGKPLEDAIADAKDVTLNFNRKGTGDKGNAEIRDLFIFVNPAIQALANMYWMAKKKPLRLGGVALGFVAFGIFVPIINQWLTNLIGDDDDKDSYWNLPPWVRKNNLVMWIPGTHDFITIPLAQEFRVFYGIGEMIGSYAEKHPHEGAGLEIVESLADLIPINPTGNGGNLLVDFSPTGIQPLMQINENVDFTGKPIWKENQGNKYDPAYSKAYVSTPKYMVRISEAINEATGGDDDKRGALEKTKAGRYLNNPAIWNHLLQGYFGGMYNTVSKAFDTGASVVQGEMPEVYRIPVLNRFLNRPSERESSSTLGEDYWKLIDEREELLHDLRAKQSRAAEGDKEAEAYVSNLVNSEDYKRAEVIGHYKNIIDDLRKGEKEATESADKIEIKETISMYRDQMMEEITAIDGGLDPMEAARKAFDKATTFAEKNRLRQRMEDIMRRGEPKNKPKKRDETVDKALSYRSDSDKESRDVNEQYLMVATSNDIEQDARLKDLKKKIRDRKSEYSKLVSQGKMFDAAQYRRDNNKWWKADMFVNDAEKTIKDNQKLLGKGRDANIMKLIRDRRAWILEKSNDILKE